MDTSHHCPNSLLHRIGLWWAVVDWTAVYWVVLGGVNSYLSVYSAIFGMVTNDQTNNQVNLEQACSWPVWEGSLLQNVDLLSDRPLGHYVSEILSLSDSMCFILDWLRGFSCQSFWHLLCLFPSGNPPPSHPLPLLLHQVDTSFTPSAPHQLCHLPIAPPWGWEAFKSWDLVDALPP